MTICLLAACLLAAPPTVEVTPLDGAAARGQLAGLAAEEVSLQIGDEVRKWSAPAVEEVRFPVAVNDFSPLQVVLADGSELHPAQVTLGRSKAFLEFAGTGTLEVPIKQVRSVLFKRQNTELSRQWSEIAKAARTSDAVVVRRKPKRESGDGAKSAAAEESLDFVEGTVTAISPETVEFDLGDDQSSLKREKLDGIVFGRRGAGEALAVRFRLLDAAGSKWNLTSFSRHDDELALELSTGLKWRMPQAEVASIDFSPGNVIYLDSDAADVSEIAFDLVPPALKASTEQFFRPQRITPASGERLRLGQQNFNRGLLLHGEARLVYQVPAGCQRFTAVAGLPSPINKQAHAKLTIAVDGQPPFEQTLSLHNRGPFPIDLSVAGAKKLTIRLEDASGLDLSDQVLLCKARFLK